MIPHRSGPPVLAAVLLATALAVTTSAQELLRVDTGVSGAGFGRAAPAGDVNGDGHDDLIVGAPNEGVAGRARVFSGANGAVLFTFSGSGAGDLFGWSCAGAGDVDGDGRDDLIVGAPQTSVSGGRGYARLLSGANGSVLRTFNGAAAGDRFGTALAGAGDLNGDGRDDVLVGAPQNDAGGSNAGSATAFSGATGAVLHSTTGGAGQNLGGSIGCDLPDTIKADDEPDVIIGLTMDGGDRSGAVQVRSRANFSLRFVLAGQAGQRLGATLAPAGDVNGDGYVDLLVATDPRDAQGVSTAAAQVRLYSGGSGALLSTFSDGQVGSGFGAALAALGDVTGDEVPDLAVGEPGHDGQGLDAGGVRIYSGSTGKTWYHVLGPAAGAAFGASVAFAGDLNADGLPDCSVGAPAGLGSAGHVYSMTVTRWQEIGNGLPGTAGVPRLTGEGGLVASAQASLTLTDALPGTVATLVLGYTLVIDPTTSTLTPASDLVIPSLLVGSDGTLEFEFTWPAGLPSGTTVYHQFRIVDPSAALGQSRSNTVAALVP